MDFTMLRQMSRRAHVEATFQDDEVLRPLERILNQEPTPINAPTSPLSGTEQAQFLSNGAKELSPEDYNSILHYLQRTGRPYHSVQEKLLVSKETLFLPPYMHSRREVQIDDYTYSCRESHEGNSAIRFVDPSTQNPRTGSIERIWTVPLNSVLQTFFGICPHRLLPREEEVKAPFTLFHEKYATQIVDCELLDQLIIVEQHHIITHLTTYRRPSGTYGIPKETLVICWALNRGRR